MPVRSRIHSSEVSMTFSRSVLCTTLAGRYEPVPMIRAYMAYRMLALNGSARSAARALPGGCPREGRALFLGCVGGRFDHTPAAVKTIRGDAMAQVRLAGLRVDRQGGLRDTIVRAVHSALGWSLATLLNWHICISVKF